MAVEDQIVTALKNDPDVAAIVGARVYAMPAPQGAKSPFITYQITGVSRRGLSYAGTSVHDVTGLQIDCWADRTLSTNEASRYAKVTELARAVRRALDRRGLTGDDMVDRISWVDWSDLNTPDETRRTLDFTLAVRDP